MRPALVRALAAQSADPRVRKTLLAEVERGQDFFRSAVIEALGDYRAAYAVEPLMRIAQLTGPLQVDAVIALGKLKDPRAMETLAALQRTAAREIQPSIAAAICLLGVNCDVHVPYLIRDAEVRGVEPRISGTAAQHGGVACRAGEHGKRAGFDRARRDRHPISRSAAGAAGARRRNGGDSQHADDAVVPRADKNPEGAIALIAEGFDMLEEDYEEESFFAAVRRGYWQAAESSDTRRVGQALIDKLEF